MSESDGRLAPVTYLPGVTPPSDPLAHQDPPTLRSVLGDAALERDDEVVARIAAAAEEEAERRDAVSAARDERRTAKAVRSVENVSMHALTRRSLSRRELERTLRSREIDDEEIAAEIARLEGVGLIDDQALAQQLVGTLQERKGLGRTGIAAELARRMLAPAAIEYALELVDSGDELARARELAQKRAGQLRSLDHETAVRRLSGYLARRGYSGSTVRSAVDAALPKSSGAGSTVRFR